MELLPSTAGAIERRSWYIVGNQQVLVGAGWVGGQSSVRRESRGRKLIRGGVWSWSGTGERDENRTCLPGKEFLHKTLTVL
jgi:hypothetical protein